MQNRTITYALLAIRKDCGEARDLAEKLLAMRGVTHLPKMTIRPASRGQAQRIVLEALSD